MPSQIGHNQHESLKCKVDTDAGGNVMSLHVFAKLFPKCISSDDKPLGLHPSQTCLTVHNRFTIPKLGALNTAI